MVAVADGLFMSARMRVTEGTCVLRYSLQRWAADGTSLPIAHPTEAANFDPPVGEWVTLRATYTVPAGVDSVAARIGCNSIPDGVTVVGQIDRTMLVVNPPAANTTPSYVDGDSPGGVWLAGGRATGRSQGVPMEPLTSG